MTLSDRLREREEETARFTAYVNDPERGAYPNERLAVRVAEANLALASEAVAAAYEAGWRACAEWAERDDLLADMGSPAYEADRLRFLNSRAAVTGAGSTPEPQRGATNSCGAFVVLKDGQ